MRRARDGRHRYSMTQNERVASLRYQIEDAKSALVRAVDMSDWRGVEKYARQLESLSHKLYASLGKGRRRLEREARRGNYYASAGYRFGRGHLP